MNNKNEFFRPDSLIDVKKPTTEDLRKEIENEYFPESSSII